MTTCVVTADLGNSRCKLRAWRLEGDGFGPALAAAEGATSDDPARVVAEFARDLARHGRPTSWALSSVAAATIERGWAVALGAAFGAESGSESSAGARVNPPAGLAIETRAPEKVGRDRLFAARGAWEIVRGAAVVVDAGTALTVDALRVHAGRGVFLGGAIAPGPAALAESLARHTARLPRIEPTPGAPALGRDTESALAAGVVVGFRGAARELARRVAEEAGILGAPVVVTGGARAFVLVPEACFEARVEEVPDLVHLGLLWAARDGARGR